MRDGWRLTTLSEVATRTIGRTPPRNDPAMWTIDTERPFVSIADLGANRVVTAREGVSELAEATGKAKRFPTGSLLLSFKLSIGRVGIADRDVFTNEAIARLVPGEGVSQDYLALALEGVNWDHLGGRAVKGKTMNKSSLDLVPIALPPLDEQRRIVDLIASVDDAVEAAETEAAATEDTTRATALQLIEETRGDALTLGDVATWRSGGTPPVSQREFYENGTVRWANIRDVQNGPIAETANRVTESGAERAGGSCARGTVLVTMYGSIGRSALVEEPMATNQAILQGTANEKVTPAYLQRWIALSEGDLDALGRGATQRNINAGIVKSFPIVVPPRDEQQRIVDTVACVVAALDAARSTAESLRTLRSNLLTVLLSGEHEIPSSYDALLGEVA